MVIKYNLNHYIKRINQNSFVSQKKKDNKKRSYSEKKKGLKMTLTDQKNLREWVKAKNPTQDEYLAKLREENQELIKLREGLSQTIENLNNNSFE